MDAYFAFTDECGIYQKNKSEKFLKSHPYYVRATVIISLNDYLLLQDEMIRLKETFNLSSRIEIKWSHLGSAIKKNYIRIPHSLSVKQLEGYFFQLFDFLNTLESIKVYFTLTENKETKQIGEIPLLKMHLQNALQKIQSTMSDCDGFAVVIADDLNDKTKQLKQAVYELTTAGDYVKYTNIKKGLYIDFSDQCHGLQIADIYAGAFTATLKYISASSEEKHKFKLGYDLFTQKGYKKTRSSFYHPPYYDTYKFGVKEVPNNAGHEIALCISRQISKSLESDLMQEIYSLDK